MFPFTMFNLVFRAHVVFFTSWKMHPILAKELKFICLIETLNNWKYVLVRVKTEIVLRMYPR